METTIQVKTGIVSGKIQDANVTAKSNTISDFWKKAEFNRFGIVPMLLIVVVCIGGIAAAVTIQDNVMKLAVIAVSTTLVECFVLAVMPMRTIIISTIIAIALSLLMMII